MQKSRVVKLDLRTRKVIKRFQRGGVVQKVTLMSTIHLLTMSAKKNSFGNNVAAVYNCIRVC